MKSFYLILVLIFTTVAHSENCLPKFKIADKQLICVTDSDCILVGDACRTCGAPYVANKKFKTEIELQDQTNRKSLNCILACEACAQSNLVTQCKGGRCLAVSQ